MYSFLNQVFKDIDSKISCSQTSRDIAVQWKKEFGFCAPHNLEYRLSYIGTIFSLYQKDIIQRDQIRPLIYMMYYEKFIRDDTVEEVFFSRVDLDKKVYLKELINLS